MSKQISLFEEKIISRSTANIVLSGMSSKKMSKDKLLIRKKIDIVSALKEDIGKLRDDLLKSNQIFLEKTSESQIKMCEVKEKLLIKLFKRHQQKGFSKWHIELLEYEIFQTLNGIMEANYTSKEIESIREEMTRIDSENLLDEDVELRSQIMKEFFDSMGIDMADVIDEIDLRDPNAFEKFREEFVKKHEESENREMYEAKAEKLLDTDKDFKKLYRKLVKEAHPDLATNEEERIEREIIMKKISEAWEKRNYLDLLLLEKELDFDDENFDLSVDSDQIKAILKQLDNEIYELKNEEYCIKNEDPQLAFIYHEIHARSPKSIDKNIAKYVESVLARTEMDMEYYEDLATKTSTKELLNEIRESQSFMSGFFEV